MNVDRLARTYTVDLQTCPGRYPEYGESPDHDWVQCSETQGDPASGWAREVRYHVCRLCGEED